MCQLKKNNNNNIYRREPEAVEQDPAGVRDVREEVRVRDHDEAPPGHPHRGETLQLQGLRQAVHAEGKPQGEYRKLIPYVRDYLVYCRGPGFLAVV